MFAPECQGHPWSRRRELPRWKFEEGAARSHFLATDGSHMAEVKGWAEEMWEHRGVKTTLWVYIYPPLCVWVHVLRLASISFGDSVMFISSRILVQWHQVGSFKSAKMGVFTLQKLANCVHQSLWGRGLGVRAEQRAGWSAHHQYGCVCVSICIDTCDKGVTNLQVVFL